MITRVLAGSALILALGGVWLSLRAPALPAQPAPGANLVQNGDFSQGVDAKGWPKYWQCAGDATVDQTLSLDHDPQRGPCARLVCRSITGSGGASHVMIDQVQTIPIAAGQWYRVSFWARQEGIQGGALTLAISETKTWGDTGIHEGFRVPHQWRHFEFQSRANISVPAESTRFQIWHHSPGTLWLSDVSITAGSAPQLTYAPLIETAGRKNLIANSSFECGKAGWGGITQLTGWSGNLNQLVGDIDGANAQHGTQSLKITLDDKTLPIFNFDYFDLQHEQVRMPLAANVGWIPVEQGSDYTLSAYLKADKADVPAVLAVYFGDQPVLKKIKLTTAWQRYSFTTTARDTPCFVAVGPDLRDTPQTPAVVWLDAVQFERGAEATPYAPADPVEIGINPRSGSLIGSSRRPVVLEATAYNDSKAMAIVALSVRITDFLDSEVAGSRTQMLVRPGQRDILSLTGTLRRNGFYRATVQTGLHLQIHRDPDPNSFERTRVTEIRFANINPYRENDSFWGMNHAYPWNSQIQAVQQAGVTWMRDWSLKWQFVEPQQGTFTFNKTDEQINRPLALGERMLLLLPFPSSNWASSAPETGPARGYPGIRERMAYMPRDPADFGRYVTACVNHYKDRTRYWEILNESLYTDYSLPQGKGFKPSDYVTLLKTAYSAAKQADPQSFVIGGTAGSGGQLYEEIIKAGGLDYMDALNIHTYPGLAPPENSEGWLTHVVDLMRAAGKPKPIWLTEYGYYAEDEPSIRPLKFEMPVVESEKLCAAYYVRFNTIMLANGVVKLFYHAGTSSRLNHEELEGIFFDYGNAPRKMFTAQAAMANLFPPGTRFVERLPAAPGLRLYLFQNATGPLLVAWAEEDHQGRLTLANQLLSGLDIEGNAVAGRRLTLNEYPVYVQGRGIAAAAMKRGVKIAGE